MVKRSLPPPAVEIIRDCCQWAEGFPDTDEVSQGILDEIARRAAPCQDKVELSDDEGDFDLPPEGGVGTKWRSEDELVLDVSEHYFVEIGEVYHADRDKKLFSAVFRDKRNPCRGVAPSKGAAVNVEGLRELLRWVRSNAQQLRSKGTCKCGRLAVIGADLCAKHCLQAVTKGEPKQTLLRLSGK